MRNLKFFGIAMVLGMRHFNKHFIYNTPKKCLARQNFGAFSPRCSENWIHRWAQSCHFFLKSGHFLKFPKKGRWSLSGFLCVCLDMMISYKNENACLCTNSRHVKCWGKRKYFVVILTKKQYVHIFFDIDFQCKIQNRTKVAE